MIDILPTSFVQPVDLFQEQGTMRYNEQRNPKYTTFNAYHVLPYGDLYFCARSAFTLGWN